MGKSRVKLIEYDRNRAVLEIEGGRLVVEANSVRFHRNNKGRGVELLARIRETSDGG